MLGYIAIKASRVQTSVDGVLWCRSGRTLPVFASLKVSKPRGGSTNLEVSWPLANTTWDLIIGFSNAKPSSKIK